MLTKRREFCRSIGLLAGGASLASVFSPMNLEAMQAETKANPPKGGGEEDFWAWISSSYSESPNLINLNNGGVSPQPKVVQDAFETYNRLCNEGPSYYMWRILDQGRETLRAKLAMLAGCQPEELAIDRNTTEALNTVIFGMDLKKGDEVVLTKQDYPNVINAWKQREMRDEIKIRWVNFNLPIENDDEIVQGFADAFNSRTRVVNITHMINWTGQLLPVRKIADKAHSMGIEVIVDAAHTFAHLNYRISDLGCDYLGTSLHKWLCAPFGSGMLYVKKEKIKDIYAMHPTGEPKSEDIKKFEALGTRSFPTEQAIGAAINFHTAIGAKRKENRLRFLKNYWAEEVAKMPGVKMNTSFKPEYSCALANFSIEGKKPAEIEQFLFNKYKIHTVAIEWENISGLRVTPHVYTRLSDLDRLVAGIGELTKK